MNSYLQVKKFMGPEKTEELWKGWTPMSCKGQVQQIKSWLKKLDQGQDNTPVEAPQASPSTSAKQAKENPKDQSEGKDKAQVEQALPSELQNSQEREDSHGQCVQYGKNSDRIQKQGRGKIEPIFTKDIDLVRVVT
ncbi:hypothetical protein O181_003470 [Austropuccinia psidii MF-1]|uniref:Uncharacterized protein n=1 Tax=Austropuccinia psidii MF-1 TaxID=1389203 RepID=A0A9Q3BF29_9BASI|nr:hypothetical protein [Austropuccinia psidii MF-1]